VHQRSIADFGRRIGVDTHPFPYASYVLPIRRYRTLQFRFLHCMGHPKPACDLLRFGLLIRAMGL
jgi:hypothetical protein